MSKRYWVAAGVILLTVWFGLDKSVTSTELIRPEYVVQQALRLACNTLTSTQFQQVLYQLPGSRNRIHSLKNLDKVGWRAEVSMDTDMLLLERPMPHRPGGNTIVQYEEGMERRPRWMAIASSSCLVKTVRRLDYDKNGALSKLHYLDAEFSKIGATMDLNPPIPSSDPKYGIQVAVVDTGVNYLLPEINARLAREASGEVRGYDFWDLDHRPFDLNPIPSPFFPTHHGTKIASIIIRASPDIMVMPYRFPRSDMSRMGELIAHASRNGARIVNVSLASAEFDKWSGFRDAVAQYPRLLFVVAAGNDARDIDIDPIYPAAFNSPNLIVVTASTNQGYLASYANWGIESVDLAVPADEIEVTDFNGQPKWVGGSSYAAARVSGLAACILAKKPSMYLDELQQRLFEKAQKVRGGRMVRYGLIPESRFNENGIC